MPALPSSLFEPVWVQFAALWPEQPEFDPAHPLGCHRRRIPDRVVFEHVIAALVHGSGYERVASDACSDRTICRRLRSWAQAGLGEQLHELALDAYDRMIGLDLADVSADGAITKAPCGGDRAGRSPVDRGKGGMKRSTGVDGYGIPLGITSAPANRHDSPLLRDTFTACSTQLRHHWPEQVTAHLDRGYDSNRTRDLLEEIGFDAEIARKGIPTPVQIGKRWVVERTNSWMNGFGKIRRCTDRDAQIIDLYLYLAATIVTIRQLIQRARTLYRWDTRPTTRRLK
ncbi:IS5 family transposase [Micromonospora cremea]|uniref:Putative transposase of IS4/5 family n=1 Tax=Micromonospora cremea TaxID=709881 RepID=A0A1N5WNK3_9ACTN|nr:IS5 family transposase [Micromonospora cremea]SIM86047.1 Putative transposase of IS4/5 family [Micromonospora cremea]